MIDLILAILSSAAVSVMLRIGEKRSQSMYGRFAMNYLSAALVALIAMQPKTLVLDKSAAFAAVLGALQGILYLLTLVALQINIRKNGIILSSTFAKLGVAVPVMFAVVAFQEMPSITRMLGFTIACIAIWVMQSKPERTTQGSRIGLLLLLICSGMADSFTKVFEELGSRKLDAHFLLFTFLAALAASIVMMLYRKERVGRAEVLYGFLVGIPNYGSVFFMLRALTHLPAVLVYPTFSAGAILVVTLVGVLAFRERPQPRQWGAMAMILVALVLLNIV